MIYYIDNINDFNMTKEKLDDNTLFVEKISEDRVILNSHELKGEMNRSLFKKMIYDFVRYYDKIILNWHMTIPSFDIRPYPDEGKVPKTVVRYNGNIVGINPFIQDIVGDIIKAIADNLKHRNKKSDIITVDFMENSIDNNR